MSGIFIRGEPRSIRRNLEEYAAGLAKVDGLEPKAIDDGRDTRSNAFDLAAHRQLVLFVVDAPGKVMDGAHAPRPACDVASLADIDRAPRILEPIARPTVFARQPLESKDGRQELCGCCFVPFPQPGAVQPANLALRCNGAVFPGCKRTPGIRLFNEHQSKAMRIHHGKRALAEACFLGVDLHAVLFKPFAPVRQAPGWNLQANFDREPVPLSRRSEMCPGKEGQIRSGPPFGIGIEQVVGSRIVLIDALLDQPHAEQTRIEIEILLGRSGNGSDVVKPIYSFHLVNPVESESQLSDRRRLLSGS